LPHSDELAHPADRLGENLCTRGRYPVRATTVVGFERLDQASFFQSGDGPVESAGTELHSPELLDVLEEGVTVLGAAGEAREDQDWRVVGPSPCLEPIARSLGRRGGHAGRLLRATELRNT